MSITTYSELKTAVADFLNRDDLTSVIPTFIALAEAQIAREVRHWLQEKRATATLNERYEVLPNDFLEMRRLELSDGSALRVVSGDVMADLRYKSGDIAGRPTSFRLTANNIEFFPTPSETYTMTMTYYARIDAISDEIPTNWLLQRYPDVLLYGSLVHSAPYLKDDARVAIWSSLYQNAVEQLNTEAKTAQHSGSALVMRTRNG